jgi:uncharacterized membrane protein YbaN (DUF454 family)
MTNAAATYLWNEVVGQEDAVRQLKAAVHAPVHAYLIVGPEGSGKRAAARAFAADLLSTGLDDHGAERARQLASSEAHPAMVVVEREGASISKEQAEEVVRVSALSPLEGELQVIVLVDFHLIGVAAPRLLKSIEEPPATTIFVILAAGCFARSSPRLDAWLRTHPRFGPPIRAWQAERAIPARAKRAACMGIALGYGLFWLGARPHWPLALTVSVMMGGCALWIVTRPLPSGAGLP